MSETSYAAIVTSVHARTGKTLLARVIADYFMLSYQIPVVFDTDAIERVLSGCFREHSFVIDLADVRGQMALFDGLVEPGPDSRVVDLSHLSFRRFFDLMRDTEFVAEARHNGIEPIVFYVADRNPDSFQQGHLLLERFPDCAVVIVDNAHLRRATTSTRFSLDYRAVEAHELHFHMPALDPVAASFVEDSTIPLGDFLRAPMPLNCAGADTGDIALDARASIRAWMVKLVREIHRVTHALETPTRICRVGAQVQGSAGRGLRGRTARHRSHLAQDL
jgi:hypothetical protein